MHFLAVVVEERIDWEGRGAGSFASSVTAGDVAASDQQKKDGS
jgi:hypothetical protein